MLLNFPVALVLDQAFRIDIEVVTFEYIRNMLFQN